MDIQKRLQACVAALKAGDLPRARSEAEAAYKAQPHSASVLQLLGVVHCQAGDPGRGAEYLRKAIGRGADTLDNRINLARALVELGQYDEAASVCEPRAGGKQPVDLQRMRADIYKAQGRTMEAVELYEELLRDDPGNSDTWNNLGNARAQLGDVDGSLAALKQALELNPSSHLVHLNIGRTLDGANRLEDALTCYAGAARLAPNDATSMLELGKCLHRLGRSAEATPPLGTAARLDPKNPEVFVAIGQAFTGVANLAQAERAYRVAIQVDPRSAAAYLNLAILLEQANRTDELGGLADRADAAGIAEDERRYIRALVLRRQGRFEEALELAQSSFAESLDPAAKALFIGQVADRLGEVDTAFFAFEDMNRITATSPEARRFDGSEHRRFVEGLGETVTPQWASRWTSSPPVEQLGPAFLLGFLRSGTTLLDTILMGHEGTHVLEEEEMLAKVEGRAGTLEALPTLGADQVRSLRRLYHDAAAAVRPVPPGARIIDKNPLASLRGPLIHRLFPGAPVIFALRHPCDVVLSCFMQNFRVNQAMASFLDLTNAALFYDGVMSYWEKCRAILPLNVHTVRYEEMVEDVEGTVRPLLDFLGLDWDDRVLDHQKVAAERGYIRTPSYAQVTEGVYRRASGRWTRYRHHLEPVLPILAPWAERFGYSME